MKVFLATSFTSKLNPDGTVMADFRSQIEKLIARYEAAGREVYCVARNEGWKLAAADNATHELKNDFENVKTCDEFVALIDESLSAGVQLEIGYALALGKRITLVTIGKTQLNWTNQALAGFDKVSHLVLE